MSKGSSYSQDSHLRALGWVVERSAMLEMQLQISFCAAVGSKYAAVVAAGRGVADLIADTEAIVKIRRDINDEHRAKILSLLSAAKVASQRRNRCVHQPWSADTQLVTARRRTGLSEQTVTESELNDLASEMVRIASELNFAFSEAMGLRAATIASQLSWEDYVAQQLGEEAMQQLAELGMLGPTPPDGPSRPDGRAVKDGNSA